MTLAWCEFLEGWHGGEAEDGQWRQHGVKLNWGRLPFGDSSRAAPVPFWCARSIPLNVWTGNRDLNLLGMDFIESLKNFGTRAFPVSMRSISGFPAICPFSF